MKQTSRHRHLIRHAQILSASAIISITGLWPGSAHAQNLLSNGSFENISATFMGNGWGYQTLEVGATTIPGWIVVSDQIAWFVDMNFVGIPADDGAGFLELTGEHDSIPIGGVSQTIATTPLQTYTLSLSLGSAQDYSELGGAKTVLVTAGSASTMFTFTPSEPGNQWGTFSFDFVAADPSTEISITGISAGSGFRYLAIDNVAVVPEPAISAFILSGAAMFLRRRAPRTYERNA